MHSRRAILVIDDSSVNRKILKKILSDTYVVLEAANGSEALEIMKSRANYIACVILDLIMPVMNGYDFLLSISSIEEYSNIPILVSTSDEDSANEKKCLEAGAWDFVRKPYNADILKLRLKNIIARSQVDMLTQIKYLAEHDGLTGLYNRAKFFEATDDLISSMPNETMAFIRFDIDRFRLYNSFFGDKAGDALLKFIATFLRSMTSKFEYCTYGRIESDVFGLCIPFDKTVIDNIVKDVINFLAHYNSSYYIEPSFGVYVVDDLSLSVETMYARATMAAKNCKDKYMSYIEYYDMRMSEALIVEQEIMNDMQAALDKEQFAVYLQPKYSLKTNMPYGAEALVRWIHPTKGIIPPGKFIPALERNGFIGKLDFYMWEHTCALLRKWLDEGLNPAPISVNISLVNMYNPMLVEILAGLINKYDLSPALLNLELTESAYMDNPDLMKKTVAALQSRGFIVMMDDFGSGYSSLNTLKDITVDILKIDMKFLPTGSKNGRSERILASIVRMAGWLDLPVIMEGVETEEQKDFLESIGCGYVQGYFFARPMPVSEYEKLLRDPEVVQLPIQYSIIDDSAIDVILTSNPQVENIFKNIPQPVAVYEYSKGEFNPIRVNQVFRCQFGYSIDVKGTSRPYRKYVSADDNIRLVAAFERATCKKGTDECEYMRMSDSGDVTWYRINLQYVQTITCRAVLFAVFTDITFQKKLEHELEKYRTYIDSNKTSCKNLLIVDDSDVSRAIIKETFKNKYNILEAANGFEALDILKERHNEIAIILLDIRMPVMDGETFLYLKNQSPELADIPVVVISANDNSKVQKSMLKLGVNDYITKPYIPEVMERRVNNVLEFDSRFRKMLHEFDDNLNNK